MRPFAIHHFHSAEPLLMLASVRCKGACRVYTHRGGITSYPPLKQAQYATTGLLLRTFFHGFSGNTAHAARCAEELYRMPSGAFAVTYNGVDFGALETSVPRHDVRSALGFSTGDVVIGTAANLKDWKRIDRLVSALPVIGVPNVRLLIVGDGPERVRLETKARQLGVAEQVAFTGAQDEVASLLHAMDLFSLPSTRLESFGNAAVEAMAVGLPTVVFSDGGGLVEHIDTGETGFIVRDQPELEATLTRLVSDADLRHRVGGRGREAVRQRYGQEHATREYRALYARSFRHRRPSPA
jgi:glycosyltransferase involved in cell wall biosynthesis